MGRIKTEDKSIGVILHDNSMIFEIPVNQRKYSWQKEQVQQYWDDISNVIGVDGIKHYLGVITLIESKDTVNDTIKSYEVIDGQQRMITTILFIAALRDFFVAIENLDNAKQMQKDYLVASTNRISSNKLRSCKIDSFTFDSIVNINLGEGKKIELKKNNNIKPDKDSYRMIDRCEEEYINENIIYTYRFFYNNIVKTYKEKSSIEDKDNYLGDLEDSLNKLDIITVISDSPESMFLYFDSLNNRGLQLSQMDIVRNTFFKVISKKFSSEISVYSDLWDDIILKLDDLDPIKFLKYYCMCHDQVIYSAKDLPEVYEEKFLNIDTSESLKKELRNMIDYSKIYSVLFTKYNIAPDDHNYAKSIIEINRLGQQACHSFIMDYLFIVDDCKRRELILKSIEYMMFKRIICSSSTKKLDGIFRDLIKCKSEIEGIFLYNDMKVLNIINKNTPKDDEFEMFFRNRIWDKNYITIYAINKLEEYLSGKTLSNIKNVYIDYICTEALIEYDKNNYSSDDVDKYCHNVGNIVVLEDEPKIDIDSLPYVSKLKEDCYSRSNMEHVKEIIKFHKWEIENILERTNKFTRLALIIWKNE